MVGEGDRASLIVESHSRHAHCTPASMPSTHKGRDDAKAETGGRGKGSKRTAPRSRDETSGQRSTGARKSGNRPGASGTGPKKGQRGSSSRRRSGSRSGAGRGSKAKQ